MGTNDVAEATTTVEPLLKGARNMNVNSTVKDGKLILVIDLSVAPVQSKSAIAKAIAAKQDPSTVPANLLATTAGFTSVGDVKVSLNVMKA